MVTGLSETEPPSKPQPSTRLQYLRGMRVSTVEGTLATIFGNLTGGALLTGLALHIGATKPQIGILFSIPALANVVQPLASIWVERLHSRKAYVAILAGIARVLMSLAVLTLFLPKQFQIPYLFAIMLISSITASCTGPAWSTWMSDMVPEDIRGKYFANRNVIMNIIGMVIGLVVGQTMDILQGNTGFLILYSAGLVFAIFNAISFIWQYEPPHRVEKLHKTKLRIIFLLPLRNIQFMRLILFYAFWTFATGIAGPFYAVFMIDELRIPYFQIYIFVAIHTIMLVLASPVWGYLADKFGNKFIVKLGTIVITFFPIVWVFNTPQNYILIPILHFFGGIITAGMNLASFNLFLGAAPRKNKSVYMSLWAAITGAVGFIAPIIGGLLTILLANKELVIGTFVLGDLQMLFLISAGLIFICSYLLPEVKESKTASVGAVLRQVGTLNPLDWFGLFYNLILFTRSKGEKTRLKASKAFGELGSPLAVDELVDALDDSSPQVREQAVLSLGEIGSDRAVDILIAKLHSQEENIQAEAAEALGLSQHPKGVEPLLKKLEPLLVTGQGDAHLKIAVIEALGKIGDTRAVDILYSALNKERDPKVFPILVESLAKLHDTRVIPIALERLDAFSSRVVRRQILDSLAYLLGDDDDFYEVSALDPYGQDAWLAKQLRWMQRKLSGRKSPLVESQVERIEQSIQTAIDQFGQEKYDNTVVALSKVADVISDCALPEASRGSGRGKNSHTLQTIQLNLQAIRQLIQINHSVNLDRDETIFIIVALLQVVEEITD
ncbi:MAG: MFS transporter [bacterium]|nr:MFS transporter [bacterium]